MKEKVFDFLTTIPDGKVVTYGQTAEFSDNKSLARVVGSVFHSRNGLEQYQKPAMTAAECLLAVCWI